MKALRLCEETLPWELHPPQLSLTSLHQPSDLSVDFSVKNGWTLNITENLQKIRRISGQLTSDKSAKQSHGKRWSLQQIMFKQLAVHMGEKYFQAIVLRVGKTLNESQT